MYGTYIYIYCLIQSPDSKFYPFIKYEPLKLILFLMPPPWVAAVRLAAYREGERVSRAAEKGETEGSCHRRRGKKISGKQRHKLIGKNCTAKGCHGLRGNNYKQCREKEEIVTQREKGYWDITTSWVLINICNALCCTMWKEIAKPKTVSNILHKGFL